MLMLCGCDFLKKFLCIFFVTIMCFTFSSCDKQIRREKPTEKPSVKITFPEGYTALQIANLLEENNVCSASEFLELAKILPPEYSLTAGIKNADSRIFALEGYLFPDTYDFYIGEGAQNALWRFLKNSKNKITQEHLDRAKELGFTIDEVITLASIIQSEAGNPAEMKKVSSVFHNRLNSQYNKLESDVTILYIKDKLSSIITQEEERQKHYKLYNTYSISGLPVGAVCNPGIKAINAALYPDDTDYYFFVTDKNTNEYYYAKSFSEHKQNCKTAGW